MNKEKIAILVDSCTDVPPNDIKKYGIYVTPLKIIYKDRVYTDGVDITADEIYENFSKEIPSTSLPDGDVILKIFEQIKADGFQKVMVVTISSGLSGTFNFIRLLSEDFSGLEFCMIDTKNIGIPSGLVAVLAAENLESGMSWEDLKKTTEESVKDSKIFFCVSTLEYLQKGGRIGKVASFIGEKFNIKPIISCDTEGVYYDAGKTIGRRKSFEKAIELSVSFAGNERPYNIFIVHGGAAQDAITVKEAMIKRLPNYKTVFEGQISPTLVVHTGPGLVAVGVQLL